MLQSILRPMKECNTHLHFAILAVVTVGFLLWHTIAIFNLEQDLKNLQNNNVVIPVTSVIPAKAGIQDTGTENMDLRIREDDTQGTESLQNTESQILYNDDGSIDISNWQKYDNDWLEVIFPPLWYYTKLDVPGGSFVGNKNHDLTKVDFYNKLVAGEVRVSISSAPGDPDPSLSPDENFEMEIRNSLTYPAWSCKNIDKNKIAYCKQFKDVCSRSETVQLSDRKYSTIQCVYNKDAPDSEQETYVISEELIQKGDNIGTMRTTMQMHTYDKELIDKSIFNVMFNQMKDELIIFKKER